MLRKIPFHRAWLVVASVLLASCHNATPLPSTNSLNENENPASSEAVETDGETDRDSGDAPQKIVELWRSVHADYAALDRYSDQARLHLRYELLGQTIQESFPMSVAWDRTQGTFSCQAFRAKLSASAQTLAMGIDEPATNHLDGQVKVVPLQPDWLETLLQDPIARLYLSGGTDLPTASPNSRPTLLAPQLGWRDGEVAKSDQTVRYTGRTSHRGQPCVKVLVSSGDHDFEYWINPQQKRIHRIVFPNSVLNPELNQAKEISNLKLVLEFNNVRWGTDAEPPHEVTEQTEARWVRHFVKIPEAFPSPWIGRKVPELSLRTHSGRLWRAAQYHGRMHVAVLLPHLQATESWWERFRDLAANDRWEFVAILILDNAEPSHASTPVSIALGSDQSPVLEPFGAATWTTLGLGPGPHVVIWDHSGIMQYAASLESPDGLKVVPSVLERLNAGEQVGQEMIREYQRFYEQYLDKLSEVALTAQPESPAKAE